MKKSVILFALLVIYVSSFSQTRYKLPPQEVIDILDAPPTPIVVMSPQKDAMMFVDYRSNPSIALISQPFLRIAGLRITPRISARQRITEYIGLRVQWIAQNRTVTIALPPNSTIGIPVWSHDGKKIAFTRDVKDGVELWTADPLKGTASVINGIRINDVLDSPFEWLKDNVTLLTRGIDEERGAPPEEPTISLGPNVEETHGRVAKTETYEDMLKNSHDEDVFTYYAKNQLALVNTQTGKVTKIGRPDLFLSSTFSPDEIFLLVTRLQKPYSYRVPYTLFTRSTEVLDDHFRRIVIISTFPVSDEIPTQGVPTGPRNVQWQPLYGARLIWIEALDGGDPMKKVSARERLVTLTAPFVDAAVEVLRVQHRFSGFDWLQEKDHVFVTEFDRARRWRTTSFYNLAVPSSSKKTVFDVSSNDAYADPGRAISQTSVDGETTVLQDGEWIYLSGRGASEKGDMPFLDRMSVKDFRKERLFRSSDKSFEQFVSFVPGARKSIITRYEDKTSPPNYFVLDLVNKKRNALTDFRDPAPQLTGMRKELVKYARPDGVPLSGTLFLPPNYRQGVKLPLLIWAYPLEYSDAGTAGQVRGSANTFTFFRGASQLFFVTQGYAVLNDATMPVVGDPETMNNTFVEQIVAAAKAAIDKLDSMGVIDRNRVLVSGHSYGAFMTANLLAHSDLFAAGIARSGAYNRTLTPFGFQSERRSFWDAPDVYLKVSPFSYANKIKAPILLIHGEADNNSGTFPIQSERLYQALQGNGGTARLVMLPFESHGYSARESVLHVLAESFEWADKYVKNRQIGTENK
jgi:dipeptidyl aminopeptidase/acylaminoacyl peptidase